MATTYSYQAQPKTFSAFPPVVKILLIVNVVIFLAQMFIPVAQAFLLDHFALWSTVSKLTVMQGGNELVIAERPPFQVWQLITYGFIHGGYGHIIMNMFALWMFGSVIEKVWGSKRFAFYYIVCIIGSAVAQLIVLYVRTQSLQEIPVSAGTIGALQNQFYSINVPTVGASGGVFGVLLAFGMMFPRQPIYFILIPVPIQARWFVIIYGAIELFLGVTGTFSGVAHFAHLGGMVFGFVLIQYWLGKLPWKPPPGKLF